MTWASINCAYARLAQIVGLNRVVNTTYRMAESPYLYLGQPENDRPGQAGPLLPIPALATGGNEMSPLDMASGAQTIANEGVHNEPYYVDYIDNWTGDRVYEHVEEDIPILDRGVALTTIDVLKGVLTNGTARNWPLNGIPAAGKTGTQAENTNAWFVGFTRNLTTAVWIGDPNGYTPMQNVPEFEGANENNVQGGRYPAQIWNTYMQPAHFSSCRSLTGRRRRRRPARRLGCTCRATSACPTSAATCLEHAAGARRARRIPELTRGAADHAAAGDDRPPPLRRR